MERITIDFETRSACSIRDCGAFRYAEDPSTDVICLAIKRKNAEPVIWFSEYFRHLVSLTGYQSVDDGTMRHLVFGCDVLEAHNAQFEYAIWNNVMTRYGFPPIEMARFSCSAAKAAVAGLPRDLASACAVAGVPQQKDAVGHRLMLKMCQPKADRSGGLKWHEDPSDIVRLADYCKQDVRAEESLSLALPDLTATERQIWLADMAINARGIPVDVETCRQVRSALSVEKADLDFRFNRLTGLDSPKQVAATLDWLHRNGCPDIKGLTVSDVNEALKTAAGPAKECLELRRMAGLSSTAKYETFVTATGKDNRLRGAFMYYGAATGRWSGRLIQPQNFPRGSMTPEEVDECIRLFQSGDRQELDVWHGPISKAASGCLRGMICATEGHRFLCADFSAIEGRVLAWLAGEESAVQVYRDGRDPYKVAASGIFGVDYDDVTKAQRQVGKVAELALGYQGASGAFRAMATNYGVSVPEDEEARIIQMWRKNRPRTVAFWAELEAAATEAVEHPHRRTTVRKVAFESDGKKLHITLPSMRVLHYCNPRVEPYGKRRRSLVIDAVNSETRHWGPAPLYGGLLAENVTSATARDLLANAMLKAEHGMFHVVLHVHDELLCEVPRGFADMDLEHLVALMCDAPDWAEGLPLKADGWEGMRYRK